MGLEKEVCSLALVSMEHCLVRGDLCLMLKAIEGACRMLAAGGRVLPGGGTRRSADIPRILVRLSSKVVGADDLKAPDNFLQTEE